MAKQFFENTTKSPKTFYGVTLMPGEGKYVEVPDPAPAPQKVAAGVVTVLSSQLASLAYQGAGVVVLVQDSPGAATTLATWDGAKYAAPVSGAGTASSVTGSNIGTRIWNVGNVGANGPSGIFLSGTFVNDGSDVGTEAGALELGEFTEVALVYGNMSMLPMYISGALAIAPSDFTDKVQDSAWATAAAFTFNGGATSAIIPPGNGSFPTLFATDFLPLASVARTDIPGATPLLYWRTKFALPMGSSHSTTSWDSTGADWGSGRFQLWTAAVYGDKLTAALGRPMAIANRRVIMGVCYRSPTKVLTFLATGTSETNNNTGGLDRQPGGWLSGMQQALSTPAKPIEYINGGKSGATSTAFRALFESLSQRFSYTHCLIEGFSTNDVTSSVASASLDINLRNVLSIADTARRLYGARVGMWSGYPRSNPSDLTLSGYTAQGDLNRKAFLTKLSGLGFDWIDLNPVVGDNASPQRFQATVNGYPATLCELTLAIHPNQAGINASLPVFNSLGQKWADAYFV